MDRSFDRMQGCRRLRWIGPVALVLCVGLGSIGLAGPIVHPYRAAPVIVKAGESFPVLFQAAGAERIEKVTLDGPFVRIDARVETQRPGEFIFDGPAGGSCTLRLDAVVPADCPEDLYDLVVQTDRQRAVARKAVKVVRAFRRRYTLVHISDAHITKDWVGDAATGHPPGLEQIEQIVNVVNIIGPDFVVHTGDAIMDSTTSDRQVQLDVGRKWDCFYDGTGRFRGVHGFDAPVFAVAGNHDHYRAPAGRTSAQYVRYNGLRTFGFAYGTGRFIVFDDSLDEGLAQRPDGQVRIAEDFLARTGPGQFRAVCQHQPKNLPLPFLDKHKVQLALTGHIHRNTDSRVGATPTRRLTTKNAGRPLRDNPGWFRVVTIEAAEVVFNRALQYGQVATQMPRMTLKYAAGNDGTAGENAATIVNGFDVAWPRCHVRFVMRAGRYAVTGGAVEQVINAGKAAVYDIRLPVAAGGKATVAIRPVP